MALDGLQYVKDFDEICVNNFDRTTQLRIIVIIERTLFAMDLTSLPQKKPGFPGCCLLSAESG